MNLAEKINSIFELLSCTNSQIAKSTGIDSSIISKYRTGKRVPGKTSLQFIMFCKGIILYASENKMLDSLRSHCMIPEGQNVEEEIQRYLISDQGYIEKVKHQNNKPYSTSIFSKKFNSIMILLNIQNIRIARAVNVDSSLISRFRSGLRAPARNSNLIKSICVYFIKIAKQNKMEDEMACLTGFLSDEFKDETIIISKFADWFFNKNEPDIMDNFLGGINSFSLNNSPNIIPGELSGINGILSKKESTYHGSDGLREAVVRFLGNAASLKHPNVFKLYSDQNISWLNGDAKFLNTWKVLMISILLNGSTIKIIHNIERTLPEMLSGIEKWLPLYMSGLVEGYYSKQSCDESFTHTLFVNSNKEVVQSCLVQGTEKNGTYYYYTDEKSVQYYENQFDSLLSLSKPLVMVYKRNRINEYNFLLSDISNEKYNCRRFLLSPSVSSMPADLLHKILLENNFTVKETESILEIHETRYSMFKSELEKCQIVDYIVFPEKEDFANHKVKVNLADLFIDRPVYYTEEDFSLHIKSIISYLENRNYNIIPVSSSPYENIQILVKENNVSIVQKTDSPVTCFRFDHPIMCKAINEYIELIGQSIKICSKDELIGFLRKY